jgi:hypothetical protein
MAGWWSEMDAAGPCSVALYRVPLPARYPPPALPAAVRSPLAVPPGFVIYNRNYFIATRLAFEPLPWESSSEQPRRGPCAG